MLFLEDMTEDENKLLAVFEVRIQDIITLCDDQKSEIEELKRMIAQEKQEKEQTIEELTSWKKKYINLLTTQATTSDPQEMKEARLRLSKLVREVDKCITLLNG